MTITTLTDEFATIGTATKSHCGFINTA